MHIQSLYIKDFKNVKEQAFDLSSHNGLTLLIGNNGCGKSNILECISSIFCNLYQGLESFETEFSISYKTFEDCIANIEYKNKKLSQGLTIPAKGTTGTPPYPKRIIAIYSGEEQRMWEKYYLPSYSKYIKEINKQAQIASWPSMLYLNKYYWDIALLSILCSDSDDSKAFVKEILGITTVENIQFTINSSNYENYKDSPVLTFINSLNQTANFSLDTFKVFIEKQDINIDMLFMYLYIAFTPKGSKVLESITIHFNGGLTTKDLSEGQKKLLLIKAALEYTGSENTLYLLDEPDAHIHVINKIKLLEVIQQYTNNRHIILTTHSPSMAASVDIKHILSLGTDSNGFMVCADKDKCKLLADLTNNLWNLDQQNAFITSNKPLTVLVEGQTDKTHIEEAYKRLQSRYPDLDFDVFSMNSSEHIREVLIGLSCSEIKWNKKFIGIFDNDKAGKSDINNGFEKDDNNEKIKHVKYKDGIASTNFYAFLLPKTNEYNPKESFTIENCYPSEKYQEAVEQAVSEKHGYYSGLSIDKVADDIKNKSKTILAANCKSFKDEDFDYFSAIFDLIDEIRLK